MGSKYDWLLYPWIAWPSGLIIGILSTLMGKWIWEKLRPKKKEYFNISYSNNELRFEGQYTTYNPTVSSINILKDIFKYKPSNNNKTNLIEFDEFFKYWIDNSLKKN